MAFAVLLALTLALAACSSGGSESAAPDGGGETVSLSGAQFSPGTLTIAAGTTVTFTDGAGHTVTEGTDGTAVDDPIVDQEWGGEPIEVTFDEPGTYNITCRIHPSMNMTITVEG
jgi:plastocyanin